MMPVQQVPWKSIYLAGGLLIAGAPPAGSPGGWQPLSRGGMHELQWPAPTSPCRGTSPPPPAAPDCSAAAGTATAAQAAPLLRPSSTTPAGLTMFISGMVLWQTEGTEALIGLWVLGLLVFIPGFYFTCAPGGGAVHLCCIGCCWPASSQSCPAQHARPLPLAPRPPALPRCRRIAYMVYRGRRGYSWDDIPEFPAMS